MAFGKKEKVVTIQPKSVDGKQFPGYVATRTSIVDLNILLQLNKGNPRNLALIRARIAELSREGSERQSPNTPIVVVTVGRDGEVVGGMIIGQQGEQNPDGPNDETPRRGRLFQRLGKSGAVIAPTVAAGVLTTSLALAITKPWEENDRGCITDTTQLADGGRPLTEIATDLVAQRGYHFTASQILRGNPEVEELDSHKRVSLSDTKTKLPPGVYCFALPALLYPDQIITDGEKSVADISLERGVTVKTLRNLNRRVLPAKDTDPVPAETILWLDKNPDTKSGLALRPMKELNLEQIIGVPSSDGSPDFVDPYKKKLAIVIANFDRIVEKGLNQGGIFYLPLTNDDISPELIKANITAASMRDAFIRGGYYNFVNRYISDAEQVRRNRLAEPTPTTTVETDNGMQAVPEPYKTIFINAAREAGHGIDPRILAAVYLSEHDNVFEKLIIKDGILVPAAKGYWAASKANPPAEGPFQFQRPTFDDHKVAGKHDINNLEHAAYAAAAMAYDFGIRPNSDLGDPNFPFKRGTVMEFIMKYAWGSGNVRDLTTDTTPASVAPHFKSEYAKNVAKLITSNLREGAGGHPYPDKVVGVVKAQEASNSPESNIKSPVDRIADAAMLYAWQTGGHGDEAQDAKNNYATAMYRILGMSAEDAQREWDTSPWTDCERWLSVVLHASGVDTDFPTRLTNVALDYLVRNSNPSNPNRKYQEVHVTKLSDLHRGDILIYSKVYDNRGTPTLVDDIKQGHTYIIVNKPGPDGKYGTADDVKAVGASWWDHVPQKVGVYLTAKLKNGNTVPFRIFRFVGTPSTPSS